MKKLILFFFLASALFVNSQTVPLAIRMDLITCVTLEKSECCDTIAVGYLSVTVKNYEVYKAPSGQLYVEYINSRFVKSRKYLGYTHGYFYQYEGNTVFLNADTTKAWLWTTDRYGQIFKMDLPDWFAKDLNNQKDSIPIKLP
jgi:hypothetical protein